MSEKPKILLDRQTLTVKAVINEIEVSNSGRLVCKLRGVSIIPVQVKIEPLKIKENLVRKSPENQIDIQNKLFEENYYVNVLDYSLGEISFAANFICQKWAVHIWNLLNDDNPEKKQAQITLTTEAIKKQVLKENPNLFKSLSDIDDFCIYHKISVDDFVVPAKFSQLEIELEAISARLGSEIFFFRKKLFAELFIQKIDSKLFTFEKSEKKAINSTNKVIYQKWKSEILNEIQAVQKYIKSPFIFEDFEQFFNYDSIEDFVPIDELAQDLVSETFYWIDDFPKVKDRFTRAVELYNAKSDFIDCVNNLRLTLEILVKNILKNDKNLENQLREIGKYQESLGIGVEIRNTFNKVLDYYNKYQNKRVKHDTDINSEHEVEFIFGLTMIFIRMLIKPNNELNRK
nr:hypothetical protein [Allomuricauda sp.]